MEQITQQFEKVTPVVFDALAAKVKELTGVVISGPSGTETAEKYTITWSFDAASGDLEITCNDAPWPKNEFPQLIAKKIHDLVSGVLAAPQSPNPNPGG